MISCFFIVLIAPLITFAQEWNPPTLFKPLPGVSFTWRLVGTDLQLKRNQFEMLFDNSTDSTITFSYLIVTDQKEKLVGRTILLPHKTELTGWMFIGTRIVNVGINDQQVEKSRTQLPSDRGSEK